MLVRITADDQVLEQFCYLPLVSGEVYEAHYSKVDGVEYKTYFDVIFDEETTVRGVIQSRLHILNKVEIRDYKIDQIV
jgi:hypothetical protein